MRHHPHMPDHRPPWWPENETWPPARQPWQRWGRRRFFWRFGCFFLLVVFLISSTTILVAGTAAYLLGILHFPIQLKGVSSLGLALVLLGAALLLVTGMGLRRVSAPLSQLLEAANRVAAGDYSVRVTERGPRELRSLARSFNLMARRLQINDEQRRNLLADVTHELRTPLTVIQGNLEGMLDGVYPADESRLRSLVDETQVMVRLVDDLRTLALAESGALQLTREAVDLSILLHETASTFQPQATASGVALVVEQPAEEPPLLDLDPGRFRQVISNLIANALRYTPSGGSVRLGYRLESAGSGKQVVVTLIDNGAGIPPDDLPHVFERFYKTSDSGGMGLGLAIAKHLVEAHGGTIEVDSQVGAGTTFQINLPVPG